MERKREKNGKVWRKDDDGGGWRKVETKSMTQWVTTSNFFFHSLNNNSVVAKEEEKKIYKKYTHTHTNTVTNCIRKTRTNPKKKEPLVKRVHTIHGQHPSTSYHYEIRKAIYKVMWVCVCILLFFFLIICPYYYMLLYRFSFRSHCFFFVLEKSEWIRDSERMERELEWLLSLQSEEREKRKGRAKNDWMDGWWMDGWTMDGQTYFFSYPIPIILSCLHFGHTIYTLSTYIIAIFYSILFWVDWMCVLEESLTHFTSLKVQFSPPSHHQSFFPYLSLTDSDMYFYVLFFSLSPAFSSYFIPFLSLSLSFLSFCVCELSEVRVAVVVMVDLWSSFFPDVYVPIFFSFSLVLLYTDSYFCYLVFLMCCVCDTYGWQVSTKKRKESTKQYKLISILCHS